MGPRRAFWIASLLWLGFLGAWTALAQQAPGELSPPAASFTVLVEQLVGLFPKVEGEVLEVQDKALTLSVGRRDGVQPGLELELFREGREIRHPKTGQVLGRAEQALGRVRIAQAQEAFSAGTLLEGSEVRPGDRVRVSAGKVKIVLLPLLGGVRENLVEAATHELVERLAASGRFQVTMGDAINVFLAEQGIKAEEFLEGRGVRQAAERFSVKHLLAVYFKRIQGKPYMEVRFFAPPRTEPALSTAFFVPPSIKPASRARFSQGGPANPPQAKPRSLLARLLGGELEAGTYSSAEDTIPLKEVARFPFPVFAMDVAVAPKDRVPRIAVTDGEKVYVYRIAGQKLEAEWSLSVRSMGRVITLQLADLDGDGVLEVVGNRWHPVGLLNSFILTAKGDKPRFLIDDGPDLLFALDLRGEGVKQTLWVQRYEAQKFFTQGQAEQVVLRDGKLVVERQVRVPAAFRAMGAAFSNVTGKDTRALVFVDPYNRLQIAAGTEEIWRSSASVGGGYMVVEQVVRDTGGGHARSSFYKIEPTPLAVDLDGDGIEEVVVPQNLVREGLLAVVFRGPAGFRLQSINSGFEGGITGLGAFRTEDSSPPTLIVSVVQFKNFFRTAGETQIIMTTGE